MVEAVLVAVMVVMVAVMLVVAVVVVAVLVVAELAVVVVVVEAGHYRVFRPHYHDSRPPSLATPP